MLLLALDTSTPAVTVAVHDGARTLAESSTVDAMRHGELLAPAIESALTTAGVDRRDLTRIVVGVGPGPYTGLRVGLVTARTLGVVLGIPVDGVCSLDVLAAGYAGGGDFVVATDARRKEVYWARYADGRRIEGPGVLRPADLALRLGRPMRVVGPGAVLCPDLDQVSDGPEQMSAATMAAGVTDGRIPTVPPEPMYLRRPDAVAPGAPKSVL
ncbi:MAG: tRNA (adenosine(37)-N6)-threonylcarbamoyltransferase complex dimerization subunit type 1 TsaB [Nocardioidaceae bacterium]